MSARCVVVGAGVIGLACAWRLAEAGLRVTVVDPAPGSGASGVAAGMLAPVTESHPTQPALVRLALRSSAGFPRFVAELAERTGVDVGYRQTGTLVTAFDAGDVAELDTAANRFDQLDLGYRRVTGAECRRLEPALGAEIRAGIVVHEDHSVDNRALLGALRAAVKRSGADHVPARVTRVVVDDDRAAGVQLADASIVAADAIVVAAGAHSSGLYGCLARLVRPVRGEVLRLRRTAATPPLHRTVRATVAGHSVYLVPRAGGELVVGATQREAGFDRTVSAGGVYALLRDARRVVPSLDEYDFVESGAGLRPGSPDNLPLIGPLGPTGLFAATGHYRDGILLAPLTAEATVHWVTTGSAPAWAAAAEPRRLMKGGS